MRSPPRSRLVLRPCLVLFLLLAAALKVSAFFVMPNRGGGDGGLSSWPGPFVPRRQRGQKEGGPPTTSSTTLGSSLVVEGPSDVEDAVEAEDSVAESASSSATASVKDELVELIKAGLSSSISNNKKRLMINELLLKLEAMNPTASPAYSPLLNGAWQFLYTGGISPGMLGLQLVARLANNPGTNGIIDVGETSLTISRQQPRVEVSTTVKVFGRENTFKISTKLIPESDLRLRETYVEGSTGSLKVPFPNQGIFERVLFISYLDDDLLVVRDGFGAPEILIRKPKDFNSYAGVPSSADDDSAPGAG